MELHRILPNDIDAEQAVIGAMLTDRDAVTAATGALKPDDFYRTDNKIIFQAIINIFGIAGAIDILTVKDELTKMGKIDEVGGLQYLSELPLKVPTTANAEKYIKIVEEKSLLRGLIKTANELIELGYSQAEEVVELMDSAEKKIFDLMQRKNQKGVSSITDILQDTFNELQDLYNKKVRVTGVPSGFIDLDDKTSGFHKSELILIAARPAMGKSAFALNLATNAALRAKIPVMIFTLEMSREQCASRLISAEAMVDSRRMIQGDLSDDDWAKLAVASGEFSDSPQIFIDDTPGITIAEIRAKCRKLKLEKDIGLIVIDYLQLIKGSGKSTSREQEIAEISRSLKILAKEINVPVIALSQLSRAPEARENHRPMLQDLRESGSIEQDADIVMFIYRDDYYNPENAPTNIAEIILAKNRSGSIGTVELVWMPSFTRFGNKYNG